MNAKEIQKLVTSAANTGRPAVVPEGTHVIDCPIKLPSNVLIEGESHSAILEVAKDANINLFETDASELTNVFIRGLTFSGSPNYPEQTEEATILQLQNVNNSAVFLSTSKRNPKPLIKASGISVINCHFQELKGGSILIGHSSCHTEDICVERNRFYRGAYHGKVVSLAANRLTQNDTTAPASRIRSTITDNWISHNGKDNWRHPRLKGGTSSLSAIHVDGTTNVEIKDNYIYRTAEIAVRVEQSEDIRVERNRIVEAGNAGILVYKKCHNVVLIENTISGWGRQPTITAILAGDDEKYFVSRRSAKPGFKPNFEQWPYTLEGINLDETRKLTDDVHWLYPELYDEPERVYKYSSIGIVAPRFDRGMGAIEIQDKVKDVLVKGNVVVGNLAKGSDQRYIHACDFGISMVPGINPGLDIGSKFITVKNNDIRNVLRYAVFHPKHLEEDDRGSPSILASDCHYTNNYVNGKKIGEAHGVDEFVIDQNGEFTTE